MVVDTNVLTIVGRLTKDAEMTHNKIFPVLFFTIATNRKKKSQDNGFTTEASFFDVNVFGKYAEIMIDRLKKGVQIIIVGELKQERWTDNDGVNRSRVVLIANSIQVIGGRNAQ